MELQCIALEQKVQNMTRSSFPRKHLLVLKRKSLSWLLLGHVGGVWCSWYGLIKLTKCIGYVYPSQYVSTFLGYGWKSIQSVSEAYWY
jgi:hypothetical protein